MKPADLSRVIVDTTVQPKNITFPTDAKLVNRAREKLVKLAKRLKVPLRQSYMRPNGFAVEDATGKQIGGFYGRGPDSAGHIGIMTMDGARQKALDFAKLSELVTQRRTAG